MTDPTPDPSSPADPIRHWHGVADPAYLLSEIEELNAIADRAGLGTLAYLLEMAAVEARCQMRLKAERCGGESDPA